MSTGGSEPVHLEFDGAVATLTLNRPDVFNALNDQIATRLPDLACRVERRADIRVLIIRGAGEAFCSGGDIQLFAHHLDDMESVVRGLLGDLHAFLNTLRRMPQLVITSVHGAAAGAGLSLACMGDLCIAADTAKFTAAYRKLGVSPDGGGTIGVVRSVGVRKAMQIFLAEEGFSAESAREWGLVNWVVPADKLVVETRELAARIAKTPIETIAATKRLLYQSQAAAFETQLEAEMEALLGCMRLPRFGDAVRSFLAS